VGASGIALTVQGWRGRVPAFDLVPYIHGVRALLATGAIPRHGDTGSYGSLKPPGTAWLMVPSAALFDDPRLYEYVGTAGLYLLGLLGIFLLARLYLGARAAALVVLIYGLSHHGLFLAGSLWPNGRPEVYAWLVYLASLWVKRDDARYGAAALAVWALGMYVDMALAPAFFVLPVVWLVYGPPIRLRPWLVAVAGVLVVWSPYLGLQAARGFADVRSQLMRQSILPGDFRAAWCDPGIAVVRGEDGAPGVVLAAAGAPAEPPALAAWEASRRAPPGAAAGSFATKLGSNFAAVAPVPGRRTLLTGLVLVGLGILALCPGRHAPERPRRRPWRRGMALAGVAMLAGGVASTPFLIARYLTLDGRLEPVTLTRITALRLGLLAGGLALLALLGLSARSARPGALADAAGRLLGRGLDLARRRCARLGLRSGLRAGAPPGALLALSLAVPWLLVVLAAEPGKPERFWWLWPLQLLVLVVALRHLLPPRRAPRASRLAEGALVVLVLANPMLLDRAGSWLRDGWAGADADEARVVEYVARELAHEGRTSAAIGYQTFHYPFMAAYRITNPQYKVGADLDVLLQYRHGVRNAAACAEGVAPGDEYRILETRPKPDPAAPRDRFLVSLDERYRRRHVVGVYEVFRREGAP
jgi:hypothetical protein